MKKLSRRSFIRNSALATAGIFSAPTILPAGILKSTYTPNNKINIGVIGCGRIARGHDIPLTLKNDSARIVAVCDVDKKRMKEGKELVLELYKEKTGKDNYVNVKMYQDFRDMCTDKDIDAVIISTPDHWHSIPAIAAARSGKDIYLQKPASLTIEEGRALSDTINRTGRILQIGSQQRSQDPWPHFHRACELVRNGRIGEIHTVKIGLPGDPSGDEEKEMPIPENLDYDMWLGSTPNVYYTEKRVHPQIDYSRPGWLRCEQFGAGMITGWGAHHVDTAHWGMGTEYTGPIEVEATAEFPKSGLWNVHGDFNVKAKYENGVTMFIGGNNPNGVRFEGSDGWIFVSRGSVTVTSSDPGNPESTLKALEASDPKILDSVIGPDEIHLYKSPEQHLNWLESIRTRQQPVAPAEIGHRSCSTCLVSHIAMKLPRKLYWDPINERFKNDDEANSMLSRPMRLPWRNYVQ
ncbi:MAG: Gfo/Idh/MocA family oxidoreductase [Ignavibacteriales bacterium]|nr:Gfo/Idh/MocA family oxidoreductase [Ignavibacteriales bacterium]MCB9210708.1 Gfo/Idh/MocA family oxidoreductase [Ignavibacteriales bacterium]MCB9259943.1 Gfo/Idh/MocA family oxidoreductase [Ignavibacteriales bacterium]